MSLAKNPDRFDNLMIDIADEIGRSGDTDAVLDGYEMNQPDHQAMVTTISKMKNLHSIGRNHVWAYYLRNMTRPAIIATEKVDATLSATRLG